MFAAEVLGKFAVVVDFGFGKKMTLQDTEREF